MINTSSDTTKENEILNELGQPRFSAKDVTTQNTLKAKQLQKEFELEADAKQKAHIRKQSLEDIKNEVVKNVYRWLLPFVLVLLIFWVICCVFNSQEVKSGVEWLLSTIISLFVGTLIGKYI